MNISPVQANVAQTNFGCNDPSCNCAVQPQTNVVSTQPQMTPQDRFEKGTKKAAEACKKGFKFVKTNKSGIAATAKAAVSGLLTACTILGANQLMQKVSKADTTSLAGKLALIGGITVAAADLIKNRKAFDKTAPKAE
ncbi:hypothetical protein IJ843_00420 [bacterium]|nr:hypothetical protein [bacterium]